MTADSAARLFLDRTLETPEPVPAADGEAFVFTAQSPAKSSGNEDAAVVVDLGGGRAILAVADGVGGEFAGARASALAVQTIADLATDPRVAGEPLRPVVLSALEQANERILALGLGAATTIAVVELADGCVRPYHVGDSEILLVGQRGKVKLAIVTHSPVGYAVEAGLITAADALHHADRHLVSNTLGCSNMRIEVGPARPVAARDTLLIASDGLFDNLHLPEIVEMIRKGPHETAAASLAGAAGQRMAGAEAGQPSKADDLTFVIYRRRP